jgi:O-antigen/teichoic acid export membrane protein
VMLLGAINTALWPRASAITDAEGVRSLLRRTFRITGLAAAGAAVYAMTVPLLAPWLFGHAYADAALLGQVLCARWCIALVVSPAWVLGFSMGLTRLYPLTTLVQLVVTVTVNVLLLPRIGALGSAVALVCNDLTLAAMIGPLLLRRRGRVAPG